MCLSLILSSKISDFGGGSEEAKAVSQHTFRATSDSHCRRVVEFSKRTAVNTLNFGHVTRWMFAQLAGGLRSFPDVAWECVEGSESDLGTESR